MKTEQPEEKCNNRSSCSERAAMKWPIPAASRELTNVINLVHLSLPTKLIKWQM